jgi:hypothetical protein
VVQRPYDESKLSRRQPSLLIPTKHHLHQIRVRPASNATMVSTLLLLASVDKRSDILLIEAVRKVLHHGNAEPELIDVK